jgi:hypothetical protein
VTDWIKVAALSLLISIAIFATAAFAVRGSSFDNSSINVLPLRASLHCRSGAVPPPVNAHASSSSATPMATAATKISA